MKEKILFLLLFAYVVTFGQNKSFKLTWNGSEKMVAGKYSTELPSFNKENYSFDFSQGLQFVSQWKISNSINESSVSLSNVRYELISEKDLFELRQELLPSELKYSLKNSKARGDNHAYFQLSPIIKEANGTLKRVVAFDIKYTFTSNDSRLRRSGGSKKSNIISNSVLNSGDWYRFYIDTTGVFRLTKSFLQDLGVDVNGVNPKTIKIYGNGGKMIPYLNSDQQFYDVIENAIEFVGEADGVFNNEDYILFYGEGPKGFDADRNTNINCYTDKTYYYVNVSPGEGKRIQPFVQPSGSVNRVIDTFDDYKFHEKDIHNIGTVGRQWFGERFGFENEYTFKFSFKDLVTSEPINLKVYAASVSTSGTGLQISVEGEPVRELIFGNISKTRIASGVSYNGDLNVTNSDIEVKLEYDNKGNPSAYGYLDYISIKATRALKFYNKQLLFTKDDILSEIGIAQYTIADASKLKEVWDVTDIHNVSNVVNVDKSETFSFKAPMGMVKKYVAFSNANYFAPKTDFNTQVSNQNIKGTIFLNEEGVFQDIDYIIVAQNNMLDDAERLAEINRKQYGLNVKALGLNEIYNEFSTGNQDIAAIRNLVKYVYDNASSPDKRIKYLCLFGDASYDYKDRIPNNTNIVPSWHSYDSFDLTSSYISDDFFGMMDEEEGSMVPSDKLDVAVGRILADSKQRAKVLVDKIASYYKKESFGSWRNNFIVVSDDVDHDWEGILQETTDNIGNVVSEKKPFINVVKLHMDAFQQESTAGGKSYPVVTEEFANAIDNGALVVNFFGHGGEEGLANERVLQKTNIQDFRNFNKLNCFVTVTCEFTKFDNPFRQTAGEFTFWNENAGAISLITTTRQIFVTFGITFNNTLGQYLFSFSENDSYSDYEYPSMAEALRLTKNDPSIVTSSQRRLVFFIGDPAMKLAFAKPNIRLTKINDVSVTESTEALQALSKVKLSGEVTNIAGDLLTNFNGVLSTTIYDKFVERQTLANDNIRLDGELVRLNFSTLGEIIFRGQASVTNGQFEFEFVVPKDISIPVGFGKVSFYAKNEQLLLDKTGGSINSLRIGGINEDAEADNIGPVINLYMNDENFVSGGITNESPTLLAKLQDDNGINTASGIGHDIIAILDGDETNPFVLNDYYQTELNDYKNGVVSFPFRDLEPGIHTLTVKVWDVYNNSSVSEIQFVVFDEDEELVINNVLNYPNPFVNYTEFWFNHNSSSSLDVSVQIFTVSGKLVRTLNGQTLGGFNATSSLSKDIIWDGRDDFGDKIGKGVYIYKLTVKSSITNKKVEKIEKLVIL